MGIRWGLELLVSTRKVRYDYISSPLTKCFALTQHPSMPSAPLTAEKMPPSVFYIVSSEAAERFSFYGVNAILVPFMTKFMLDASGAPDRMTDPEANAWYHLFFSVMYFLPILGAIAADAFLGKFKVIFYLSIVYCFGHFALALNETRAGLAIGLSLIAIGAGGIKPCVSAYVGDQFTERNKGLMTRAFSWFYFSVNFGSTFATIIIPYLLEGFSERVGLNPKWGPHLAFGAPGLLMAIATIIFWMGRKRYRTVKPAGPSFLRAITAPEGRTAIGNLLVLVPFVALFWAIWQQNFSAWVEQAERLDRHFLGGEIRAAQIQTVNPFFILTFLPLFSYVLYPAIGKRIEFTPLRRIGTGLFLTIVPFLISGWLELRIGRGEHPSWWWQVLAYAVLTAAEILVSVTHLEFSYTQAPPRLKSVVVSTYLLTISLGNLFTAAVNHFIQNPDKTSKLAGANYYWFFCAIMFVGAIAYIFTARRYRGRTYIQDQPAA
jgi:proton-dependent oligopeptide transporter, POT family